MTGSVRPEDYAPLKRAADAGRVQLLDSGVASDPDSFWINLRPGAFAKDPRADWMQRDELRQAISLTVDRQAFADTVPGRRRRFSAQTPANKWYSADLPHTPHDPARAKTLLASIGLTDRNGDGVLDDPHNQPARFVLLTQKGQTALERGAAVIRDELKRSASSSMWARSRQRWFSVPLRSTLRRHLLSVRHDQPGPGVESGFLVEARRLARLEPRAKVPATDWERQIDELMAKQITATVEAERKRLFDQVQRVFAAHLPVVHFVAPKIFVARAARRTSRPR